MKIVKNIVLAAVMTLASLSSAQAALVIVEKPATVQCVYYDGYLRCANKVYYPYRKYKVCTPQGICHWVYCYQGYGCQAYYPNRLY